MQSMCCFAQTEERGLLRFLLLWLNPMPAHSARSRFMLFAVIIKELFLERAHNSSVCYTKLFQQHT
ncbi:MAG: hypothetical protein A3K04_06040 [Gallionellales bacterium RBG_16_56_9]|nr:MAG: hypothetical protein A3K04_06040 [Gallionellales bacterium RBG_16_56_9]